MNCAKYIFLHAALFAVQWKITYFMFRLIILNFLTFEMWSIRKHIGMHEFTSMPSRCTLLQRFRGNFDYGLRPNRYMKTSQMLQALLPNLSTNITVSTVNATPCNPRLRKKLYTLSIIMICFNYWFFVPLLWHESSLELHELH